MSGDASDPQTFTDVACPVCSCLCDDLEVTVQGEQVIRAKRACRLSEPWFLSSHQSAEPCQIDGQPADLPTGIAKAAQILQGSRSPLIFGLSRGTTSGQRAAIALADAIGATIDTTASMCHAPSIMAIQQVGESTCTLGEVKNRSDLVIFWGADPVTSHPRHFERYAVDATGQHIPHGRSDRSLYVIDAEPTATSAEADVFVPIPRGRDFDVITLLRMLVRGEPIPDRQKCGLPVETLAELARRMTSCRYGAVFFGLGLARQPLGHQNVEALLLLVAELNDHTRFVARRLRIPGDVAGADSALCWQTGFPFAVNFARGYPRFGPGEFTANELLERREVDSCLLVGTECVPELTAAAQAVLSELPTIALDYPHVERPFAATVHFTTAIHGVHAAGTMYRMDEVPIPLAGFLPTRLPTDAFVLEQILQQIPRAAAGEPDPA